MNFNISTNEYNHWLEGIKLKIKTAQLYLFKSSQFNFVAQAVAQNYKSQLPTIEQIENQLNRYDEK